MALGIVAATSAQGATRYDPRLNFRTYRTAHFDIHAHQGEDALARRLAAIAERVRSRFEPSLGTPHGRVQVILVDQSDLSNGWAIPFPYDTIEITAAPPLSEELIGNTTDWLEVVFTHEYTHILHLDRSRGVMRGFRAVFGRAPLVFPNALLPVWQIEGLATYEESRMTGEGRIPAGDFRAIVDTAARQGRFVSLDRASGGLDEWPSGNAAYAFGAYFHQYLADRYGADRLDALADATAGRLPLFGAGAFRTVFGKSNGALWREFEASRAREAPVTSATDAAAARLTQDGFTVAAPRVASDGTIYYRVSNADGYPALMRLDAAGPTRVAWRVSGDGTSIGRDWVVFDQVSRVRSVALYSDLQAIPRAGGRAVQLTREARAADPDLSPDGRRIACVVLEPGHRALALLDFTPGGAPQIPRVLVDDPASDFSGPRWSPDGTRLVAARRRAGLYELVIVDPASGAVRPLLARGGARLTTPSWSRDGTMVLFAADPGDAPFNVFALDVDSGAVRQITDSVTGAQFPEEAPNGSLIYVGYSADGYDLYSLPAPWPALPGSAFPSEHPRAIVTSDATDQSDASGLKPGASYDPLPTLVPTSWEPVVATDAGETLVGAGTAMSDALGRHAYSASAAWAARARPDWSVGYAYDRWRPTLVASYSDDTDPIRGGEVRTRELFAGALLPFRELRWSHTLMAGVDLERDEAACAAACLAAGGRDLRALRGGWTFDSRRLFPYSISTEEGLLLRAAVESAHAAGGVHGRAANAVLDARFFQRVLTRHTVLALRVAAATSSGDAGARRLFSAAGPGAAAPAFDFGRDTIGLLRGFQPEDVVGTHAAVVNADLRVPLRRVQRGAGTWPVFVRSLHAAAFFDAGNGWDRAFRGADVRRSAGGELSLDAVVLYSVRLTLAAGAARTHDPIAGSDRGVVFARIGYAF